MSLIITERGSIWAADQRKRSGDAGTAAEPVLLLVHGAGGTHLVWNAPIRRLPNVGIVAPDLPGHGKSPEPSRDTVKAYADDMIALMDAMAIDRDCILGYSLGGAIALQTGLRQSEPLAGIVALSCYLALASSFEQERVAASSAVPIFMAHGTSDPIVPLARAVASRDALEAEGHPVEWHQYAMPHSVNEEEIRDLAAFLKRVIG